MTVINRLFNRFSLIPIDERDRLAAKATTDFSIFRAAKQYVDQNSSGGHIKILELGSGIYNQMPILFLSFGYDAQGIDDFSHEKKSDDLAIMAMEKRKTAFYYRQLQSAANRKIRFRDIKATSCDAADMPFPAETFDFVFSTAVFEHIKNIEGVISEVHRVMKPNGIADIGIHLFPSLSGSHHPLMWECPVVNLPKGIEPWYHLRGLPGEIPGDLNRLRENDYRQCFKRKFNIIEEVYPDHEEGTHLLTDEILKDLPDFSRTELLRRWTIFRMRKM